MVTALAMATAAAASPRAEAFSPPASQRLVVKLGSALLVAEDGTIRRQWLAGLVADLVARHQAGQQLIIVSSGAIALGARRLGLAGGGRTSLEDSQAAAAAGQILLAGAWSELLADHGLAAAQMLVTLGDFEDRRRWLNACATLNRLLALGAVPILNENDSVATEEIRFGDNDRLAARAAQAAGADALILLSDVDGLYTANPSENPNAELIADVDDLAAVEQLATSASTSGMGSGGMASKLEAARIARTAGIAVAIVAGKPERPLLRFQETGRSTRFAAPVSKSAHKAWLAGRMQVAGTLHVDAGAATALAAGGSLLAAGVHAIEGDFSRGDAVDVMAPEHGIIARGLVSYDAKDLRVIAGKRRDAIAAILGYAPRSAVIHRDQMVVF